VEGTAWIRSATLNPLLDLGRWDEAVDTANAVIGWEHDHGGQYMSQMAHQIKAQVLLWRGEVDAAAVLAREFLPRARAIDDLQLLVPALAVAVAVAHAAGEPAAARGLVEEVQRVVGDRGGGRWYLSQHVAELARVCVALGQRVTGEALAAQAHAGAARHRHGLLAAQGVLAEAAESYDGRRRTTTRRRPTGPTTATSWNGPRPSSAPAGACSPSAGRKASSGSRRRGRCWLR
jgi:ATP/maltotriose-dependent transcriptional regulator MalT